MTNEQAFKILKEYQLWRRGIAPYDYGGDNMPFTPKEVGEAIDVAIKELSDGKRP
jgi:hypothetical protein